MALVQELPTQVVHTSSFKQRPLSKPTSKADAAGASPVLAAAPDPFAPPNIIASPPTSTSTAPGSNITMSSTPFHRVSVDGGLRKSPLGARGSPRQPASHSLDGSSQRSSFTTAAAVAAAAPATCVPRTSPAPSTPQDPLVISVRLPSTTHATSAQPSNSRSSMDERRSSHRQAGTSGSTTAASASSTPTITLPGLLPHLPSLSRSGTPPSPFNGAPLAAGNDVEAIKLPNLTRATSRPRTGSVAYAASASPSPIKGSPMYSSDLDYTPRQPAGQLQDASRRSAVGGGLHPASLSRQLTPERMGAPAADSAVHGTNTSASSAPRPVTLVTVTNTASEPSGDATEVPPDSAMLMLPELSAYDILQDSLVQLLEGDRTSTGARTSARLSLLQQAEAALQKQASDARGQQDREGSPDALKRPLRPVPAFHKHLKPSIAARARRDVRNVEPDVSPALSRTGSGVAVSVPSSGSLDLHHVPDKVKIKIHAVTFNMASTRPDKLPTSLLSTHRDDPADIYIVGSQESCAVADWERMLQVVLGDKFVKVASETLMAIHVVLYAKAVLAPHILDLRTSLVATGVGNMLGNKGGVGVAFTLARAKVLVVTCHLAAHDEEVERRNADFHRIAAGLFQDPLFGLGPSEAPFSGYASGTGTPQDTTPRSVLPPVLQLPSPAAASAPSSTSSGAARSPTAAAPQHATDAPQLPRPPSLEKPRAGGLMRFFNGRLGLSRLTPASSLSSSNGADGGGGSELPSPANDPRRRRALFKNTSDMSFGTTVSNGTTVGATGKTTQSATEPGGRRHSLVQTGSGAGVQGSSPSFLGGLRARGAVQMDSHDVVLWMGDLNYRINANSDSVLRLVKENLFEVLYANDQLKLQQKKGKAFQGFSEQEIAFPPTFKYVQYTEQYSSKRVPSWTDRVLYMCNAPEDFAQLRPLYYDAVSDIMSSDHRPVAAGFELIVQPNQFVTQDGSASQKCVVS